MKLKRVSLIFLAFLFASCATVVPDTPSHPWGTSKEAYLITRIDGPGMNMNIYEVASKNEIQLGVDALPMDNRSPGINTVIEVYDRDGVLDSLRGALDKYLEWKGQLKDSGGKISKPIKEIEVFGEDRGGDYYNLHTLVLSFETSQDGKYYLLATEMTQLSQGGGTFREPMRTGSFRLFEDQVLALSQALSQENILAKAQEADNGASQKAAEDAKNQTLQQGLK